LELKDKIKRLTNAYGVSGDEFRVSEIAAELLKPYVDKVGIDRFGNVTGYKSCGVPGAKKLLLDAHIDQIGFMITEVTDGGFLRFIGMGVDQRMLPGSEMTVLTAKGPIPGIVAALPPHLQKPGDNEKSIPIADMAVDIGMTGDEAKKRVRVGDYMAFRGDTFDLLGGGLCGRCMDDRACFCCILHALELLQGKPLAVDLIICASTKEEMGGHGSQAVSYRENPDYAVAIDVCHARTADAPEVQPRLGDGPVISVGSNSRPKFARLAMEVARAKQIPFLPDACPAGSGTNAWTMQLMREGICTLVVSLPLKYMHSPVEVLRMNDVENVGRLLAELAQAMDGRL
jgi:putative aminopeptidase FrvX